MVKVILDGKEITSRNSVHNYLKAKLHLSGYFGNNLDALWDAISTHRDKLSITLINKDILINNLGEYGIALIQVFVDAERQNSCIEFIIK